MASHDFWKFRNQVLSCNSRICVHALTDLMDGDTGNRKIDARICDVIQLELLMLLFFNKLYTVQH